MSLSHPFLQIGATETYPKGILQLKVVQKLSHRTSQKVRTHPPRPSHAGGKVRSRACRADGHAARRLAASAAACAHCHDCTGPACALHRPPPHHCTLPCTQLTDCATGAAPIFSPQHGCCGGPSAQQPTPAVRPPASEPRCRGEQRPRPPPAAFRCTSDCFGQQGTRHATPHEPTSAEPGDAIEPRRGILIIPRAQIIAFLIHF